MNINDETIVLMDPLQLLSQDTLLSLLEVQDPEEKERLSAIAEIRAKDLGIEKKFTKVLKAFNEANEKLAAEQTRANAARNGNLPLTLDSFGKPLKTIQNYLIILENDPLFANIRFNELTMSPENTVNGKVVRWIDSDDSEARNHIEFRYHLRHKESYDDAMRILFKKRAYHPIRQYIDILRWDGKPRIESFLTTWTRCEDTPYMREVSRLIFAGGIHRLYEPGCKFDDMAVLIGTRQGEGKSTLVRWLAMRDEWFTEVSEFEGDAGREALEGAWICEVGELLALTKTKEQEAVKAYLTRLNDRHRAKYDKRVADYPRQCIFIGTTNSEQFLTDKTGGRRFHPIKVNQVGYDLFDHEAECRAYIEQCWAEARAKYDSEFMRPVLGREFLTAARQAQSDATEEDYREVLIAEYLKTRKMTCVLDLWEHALRYNLETTKPSGKDSKLIGQIMAKMDGWKSIGTHRFGGYGSPKCWECESEITLTDNPLFSDVKNIE